MAHERSLVWPVLLMKWNPRSSSWTVQLRASAPFVCNLIFAASGNDCREHLKCYDYCSVVLAVAMYIIVIHSFFSFIFSVPSLLSLCRVIYCLVQMLTHINFVPSCSNVVVADAVTCADDASWKCTSGKRERLPGMEWMIVLRNKTSFNGTNRQIFDERESFSRPCCLLNHENGQDWWCYLSIQTNESAAFDEFVVQMIQNFNTKSFINWFQVCQYNHCHDYCPKQMSHVMIRNQSTIESGEEWNGKSSQIGNRTFEFSPIQHQSCVMIINFPEACICFHLMDCYFLPALWSRFRAQVNRTMHDSLSFLLSSRCSRSSIMFRDFCVLSIIIRRQTEETKGA